MAAGGLAAHQRACLQAVCSAYEKGDRSIAFQMATGSGKTRVLLAIPGALRLARVVYVFPSLVLVQQFINNDLKKAEYRAAFPHYAVWSSDAGFQKKLEEEAAAGYCADVARLCAGDQYTVVTTYASLQQVLEAAVTADCVMFDEAHHAGADGCKKTMEAFTGCVVRASATLRAGEAPCYTYMLSEAIRDNVCRDFNTYFFVRPKGDEKRLVEYLEGHRGATGNGRVMAFTQWSEAEPGSGTNVKQFCKAHAEGIKALGGNLWSITAKDNKEAILGEFEKSPDNKLSVLVSCRTLSEGVDTKRANVALFVDAVRSTTTIVQRIGRVTRVTRDKFRVPLPKEEQRPGSVIINVYIDPAKYAGKSAAEVDELLLADGTDTDGAPNQGAFSAIFGVMAALKISDPERYEQAINFAAVPRRSGDGTADTEDGAATAATASGAAKGPREPSGPDTAAAPPRSRIFLDIDPDLKVVLKLEGLDNFAQRFHAEIEGDDSSLEEKALVRANEFKVFFEANGRPPSSVAQTAAKRQNACPAQLDEQSLAQWFSDNKKAKGGKGAGKCYPSVDLLLTELLGPEWHMPEDLEAASLVRANEFKAFYEANKRLPSAVAQTAAKRQEASPEQLNEHALASWFGSIKIAKSGRGTSVCYPSVDLLLSDLLGPEWHMPEDLETASLVRANEFKVFYEANGRLPSLVAQTSAKRQKASPEQLNEHSLASWFGSMKRGKTRNGNMGCYPSVDLILTELLGPEWHMPVDLEAAALVRANEFKVFFEANGRPPSSVARTAAKRLQATPDQLNEHALASWFSNMKKAKGGKSAGKCYPSVDLLLTELLGPEWHMPEDLEAASLERANEFKVFYEANKQIPRMIASTPVKRLQATPDQLNEQLLASWFGNMKKGKNSPKPGGMICYPSVDFLLTDLLGPEWHMSEDLEAAALARANAFKAFYEANGRPPATVAKTAVDLQKALIEQHNEHSLASWFNNMKNAKKGATSMTCYPSVDHLLSELLGPDWHLPVDLEAAALVRANEFKAFYEANGWLPIQVAQTAAKRLKASPAQLSEHALAQWFGYIKKTKGGKGAGKCYPSVDLLLTELLGPEWSTIRGKGQSQITAQSADNQPAAQPAASTSVADNVARGAAEQVHKPVYMGALTQLAEPARRAPKTRMSSLPQEAAIAEPPATKLARRGPKAMTRVPPGPPQAADAAEPVGADRAPRALAEISVLHKKYKSMRSDNLAALFREQPALWHEYHDIADANEAGFPPDEVPYRRVAARLRAYFERIPAGKPKTVVDLGCGRARLHGEFADRPALTFVNIDHVAGGAGVTVADIAHTGLEAGVADVAVLCLALWGSNSDEYFAEAYRILDPGGRLIVVEPGDRWRDAETGITAADLYATLLMHGFEVVHEDVMAGALEKKFALFEACKR